MPSAPSWYGGVGSQAPPAGQQGMTVSAGFCPGAQWTHAVRPSTQSKPKAPHVDQTAPMEPRDRPASGRDPASGRQTPVWAHISGSLGGGLRHSRPPGLCRPLIITSQETLHQPTSALGSAHRQGSRAAPCQRGTCCPVGWTPVGLHLCQLQCRPWLPLRPCGPCGWGIQHDQLSISLGGQGSLPQP